MKERMAKQQRKHKLGVQAKLVAEYLCNNATYVRPTTASAIAHALGMKDTRLLREIVEHGRRIGLPICSDDQGYWYGKNLYEVGRSIHYLKSRISALRRTVYGLERAQVVMANSDQATLGVAA